MNANLNNAKQSDDLFKLGQNYEGRGCFDEAIREYQKSLEAQFSQETAIRLLQLCRVIGRSGVIEQWASDSLRFIPAQDVFFRNILLNELEMAQKKTVLSSKIRSFTITLTNKCNLACRACEARNYKWQMPQDTINEIIEFFPYLEYIMWQGGEVFLMDYFGDVLEKARAYPNIKNLIVTNAMLLTQETIEKLIRLPELVLAISVDGTTRDTYEGIRIGASFDKLLGNLKLLNLLRKQHNSNTRLHLNVTVMKSNHRQLLEFIEFAREHDFYSVLFRPVQGNFDSPENIFIHQDKEALDFINRVMGEVIQRAKEYQIILDNRIPYSGRNSSRNTGEADKKEDKINDNARLLCYAPWQRLYISWDGNVYPDCMCVWPPDDGIGNVKRSSLAEIWNNEGMQTYRKKIIRHDFQDICSRDCVCGNIPQRYLLFNK
jgi:MoaA/NifB/PqqE/SkfB family radical SAM enzyme